MNMDIGINKVNINTRNVMTKPLQQKLYQKLSDNVNIQLFQHTTMIFTWNTPVTECDEAPGLIVTVKFILARLVFLESVTSSFVTREMK